MTYLQDKKEKRKKISLIFLGLFVFILVIFFSDFLKKTFSPLIFGVTSGVRNTFVRDYGFLQYFKNKKNLESENKILKEKINSLEGEINQSHLIKEENIRLNFSLGFKDESVNIKRVEKISNSSIYKTLTINKGVKDFVSMGDLLLGEKMGMIGRVIESYDSFSKVELLYADTLTLDYILIESGSQIEATGSGRGALVSKVPNDLSVNIGAIVALKDNIKWVVGKVVEIKSDERDPYKTLFIKMQDNAEDANYFYIINAKK